MVHVVDDSHCAAQTGHLECFTLAGNDWKTYSKRVNMIQRSQTGSILQNNSRVNLAQGLWLNSPGPPLFDDQHPS